MLNSARYLLHSGVCLSPLTFLRFFSNCRLRQPWTMRFGARAQLPPFAENPYEDHAHIVRAYSGTRGTPAGVGCPRSRWKRWSSRATNDERGVRFHQRSQTTKRFRCRRSWLEGAGKGLGELFPSLERSNRIDALILARFHSKKQLISCQISNLLFAQLWDSISTNKRFLASCTMRLPFVYMLDVGANAYAY